MNFGFEVSKEAVIGKDSVKSWSNGIGGSGGGVTKAVLWWCLSFSNCKIARQISLNL